MFGNYLKTTVLLSLLTGLVLFTGLAFGGKTGLIVAFLIAIGINVTAFWFSDKMILAFYKAQELPDTHHLTIITRNLAHRAQMPPPRVYMINSPQANAFATGRNPNHAAIAIMSGLSTLLNEQEIQGVIAHELGHIKNRDTLIATVASTLAGIISFLATIARWGALFGGLQQDNKSNGIIEFLILVIVTPFLATILQLSISRSREYVADEFSAKTLQDAQPLITALEKIHHNVTQTALTYSPGRQSTAHLFIYNPIKTKNILKLFSTHPALEDRINKLHAVRF